MLQKCNPIRERVAGAACENAEREQKLRKCDRMPEQRRARMLRGQMLTKCDRMREQRRLGMLPEQKLPKCDRMREERRARMRGKSKSCENATACENSVVQECGEPAKALKMPVGPYAKTGNRGGV